MEQRIQLKHPAGKKAVTMNKVKYETLKVEILKHLETNGASTHDEILASVNGHFKKHKIKFEGAVGWHMEWVKLDLEARKEIKRTGDKSPIKFVITK